MPPSFIALTTVHTLLFLLVVGVVFFSVVSRHVCNLACEFWRGVPLIDAMLRWYLSGGGTPFALMGVGHARVTGDDLLTVLRLSPLAVLSLASQPAGPEPP